MRGRLLAAAAAACLLPAFQADAVEVRPAAEPPSPLVHVDDEPDCTQIPPNQVPPVPADLAKPLRLRVLVLVERDKAADARQALDRARSAYKRINIEVAAVQWDTPVRFRGPTDDLGFGDPIKLMRAVKARYGGRRPPGVDLVYHFTRQTGGGLADCIGGINFPDRAFGWGALGTPEADGQQVITSPTANEQEEASNIAAHELGHLLGGHHHYSNCAEGAPDAVEGHVGCTIMSPVNNDALTRFGAVETAFIRDTLARYKPRR